MARDILSEYGRDSRQPQAARASNGGNVGQRDVMNYSPPQGPTTFAHQGPGLANADNYGCCGTQGRYDSGGIKTSGSPGLHGQNSGVRNRPR